MSSYSKLAMDKTIPSEMAESTHVNVDVDGYLRSMSEKERLAYHIAKEHLGSSFTVEKCVGFLRWKKTQEKSGE